MGTILILTVSVLFSGLSHGRGRPNIKNGLGMDSDNHLKPNSNYTVHDPIKIDNNTDFSDTAADENWSGSGTETDPWVITNYSIDGTGEGRCIYIGNTTDHFIISDSELRYATEGGSSVYRSNSGLILNNVTNGLVKNNTIFSNGKNGIHLRETEAEIVNNTLFWNNRAGVYLSDSKGGVIYNNTVSNNKNGIEVESSLGTELDQNNVSWNDVGVLLTESVNTIVKNTSMQGNGILIKGDSLSYWNTHNIDSSNEIDGEPVYYRKNTTSEAVPLNTGQVIMANCTNMTIQNKSFDVSPFGIITSYSSDMTIRDNTLSGSGLKSINTTSSDLRFNNITLAERGIYFEGSDNNSILENRIVSNDIGFYLTDSSRENDIEGNDFSDNSISLQISSSSHNNITNNTVTSNQEEGIRFLSSAEDNIVKNNTILSNDGYGIQMLTSNSHNSIEENNISLNEEGGIRLAYSSAYNDICENELYSNNGTAVMIESANGNFLSNNTLSQDEKGIVLSFSENTVLKNNTLNDEGIVIKGYHKENWNTHVIEQSNSVNGEPVVYLKNKSGGGFSFQAGEIILANCSGMVVKNVSVSESDVGISLGFSTGNLLKNNTLEKNNIGLLLDNSDMNEIYHNNLINNTQQVEDDGDNIWDNGYPSGGNYWSDYNGYDNHSGPQQDINGSDGIGDTNHSVSSITDEYPLMKPWPVDDVAPTVHSVNISDVTEKSAVVEWKTFEKSTSKVIYSNHSDLSDNTTVLNTTLVSEHSLGLEGLSPNTTYYYEVSSSDEKGNTAVDDNSSHHYSFTAEHDNEAPSIIDYSPAQPTTGDDYTFNVSVEDNVEVDEVQVQYWTDVSGNETADMIKGEDGFYKKTVYLDENSTWLKYNVSASDESENMAGTGVVTLSITDDKLPVVEDETEGSPKTGEEFTFRATASDNIDISSIRVFYWTDVSDPFNLTMQQATDVDEYKRETGIAVKATELNYKFYVKDTEGNLNVSEIFTLDVEDNILPQVALESPDKGTTGDTYTFRAEVKDNVAVGDVYVNYSTDQTASKKLQMNLTSNDTYSRTVVLPVDAKELHYKISAADSSGNLIETDERLVLIEDDDIPTIEEDISGQPTTGDTYSFRANVTDNIEVKRVELHYETDAEGPQSVMMEKIGGSGYRKEIDLPATATNLSYHISAEDLSGNEASIEVAEIDVIDNDKPEITVETPEEATTGDNLTISSIIEDNIELSEAYLKYWNEQGEPRNMSLQKGEGETWQAEIELYNNSTKPLEYVIAAVDSAGNWKKTEVNEVRVIDDDAPVIDVEEELTTIAGKPFELDGSDCRDNIKIERFRWDVETEEAMKVLYGESTSYTYSEEGNYSITLMVSDTSDNTDEATIDVEVKPLDPSKDYDNDGIPSGWEMDHGMNPFDDSDASEDYDEDGASNLEEYKADTNPNDASDYPGKVPWSSIGILVLLIAVAVIGVMYWRQWKIAESTKERKKEVKDMPEEKMLKKKEEG